MNLLSALINGPLIAIDLRDHMLHAASDESVMRGWPSPQHPKPRSTVDAVCGRRRLKLIPNPELPGEPLPWPPPARGPLTRCAECFRLSTPKRARTGVRA